MERPREPGKGRKERKGEEAKGMCSSKITLKDPQHRLRSPSRPHDITALRAVPNYTAWRQRHIKWLLTRQRFCVLCEHQSSYFHWPAELRGVRHRNLEQSTSFATSPRTVAEHLQAPAEGFSSTREPSSGAVVTEQRVRRRIQISGLNSTQPRSLDCKSDALYMLQIAPECHTV